MRTSLSKLWWAALLAALSGCNPSSDKDDAKDDATDREEIDPEYLKIAAAFDVERKALGAPAASLAIVRGGRIAYAAGFGTLSPQGGAAADEATLYRIGSTTKMLTVTALLALVEDSEVDLDASLTEYLPGFSFTLDETWAPSIEVENLLTHTSGICDYMTVDAPEGFESDDGLADFLLGPFGDLAYLMAPSGTMYNYSNPNFSLAGLLVEELGQGDYRQLMRERVFEPLGMDRTFFLPQEALADGNVATGINSAFLEVDGLDSDILPDAYDNPWARPAGYAFSSVLDLARFVLFLRDGDDLVLGDKWRKAMQTPKVSTKEKLDLISYGYGLMLQRGITLFRGYYDITLITHGGAIPGYSANITYAPELDIGLVTLASTDGAYFEGTLVQTIETLADLPVPSQPPDLSVDPTTYPELAGLYVDPFAMGAITVTASQDTLSVAIPILDDMGVEYTPALEPLAPDSFILYVDAQPMLVTFIRDDDGKPLYLRSRVAVAKRSDALRLSPVPVLDKSRIRLAIHNALRQPLLPAPHTAPKAILR
ncbi:MAG: serine hydrolase [Myxococcota bacterium]|jgi:CubicO group peptidase (beta-lactamase class C family)|nr:serine hydrolase [Myxococcota bacterium]